MLKAKLKEILYKACLYFTILVFAIYISGSLLSAEKLQMPLQRLALLFLFSLGMAFAGLIWQAKKLPLVLRHLIHFACFIFCFWGVFIYIGNFVSKTSSVITLMVLTAFLYIMAVALFTAVRNRFRRKKEKNEAYSPVYNQPQ